MKILHATISDDRTRQQGVGRYVRDLSAAQAEAGDDVAVLYAGAPAAFGPPRILRAKGNGGAVPHYRLLKALPEPLRYGVSKPHRYQRKYDEKMFRDFLQSLDPDVLHVHSLQGFPAELFRAASGLKIPMLFTTHDFYPICLRCNLVTKTGELCRGQADAEKCAACNAGARDYALLQALIQTDLYGSFRNSRMAEKGRKLLVGWISAGRGDRKEQKGGVPQEAGPSAAVSEYASLLRYYSEILTLIDRIHFNSSVTEKLYRERFPVRSGITIPITRNLPEGGCHTEDSNLLRIAFMGGILPHKGLEVFREAAAMMPADRIEAVIYGPGTEKGRCDRGIREGGEFRTEAEAEAVWSRTDVLAVPSTCPESFGFLVPEALSRGIPVICSDLVGAADCLGEMKEELTFSSGNAEELAGILQRFLNRDYRKQAKDRLLQARRLTAMAQHEKEIKNVYRDLCGR